MRTLQRTARPESTPSTRFLTRSGRAACVKASRAGFWRELWKRLAFRTLRAESLENRTTRNTSDEEGDPDDDGSELDEEERVTMREREQRIVQRALRRKRLYSHLE